jgi:cytochrome P450 family 710 subfamily A protein
MPPRAPTPTNNGVVSDEELIDVKPLKQEAPAVPTKKRLHTFHWELNLYSFAALALIYTYAVPEEYRVFMHGIFALIALDAARYYYYRGGMPGVPYTLPMVSMIAMLVRPVRFWAELGYIAMESGRGMCSNILVGNFMVFVTDPALCRKVMTSEDTYSIYAHPNALWLFGPENLIYLPPDDHKSFRAILTPALFSNEALTSYAAAQERVCRRFLKKYSDECKATGKPFDARLGFRAMAASSSQEAFLGPYLTDDLREHLERDIVTFTLGFLSFPFPYAGGLRRAIQAKNRIEETIQGIVPKAREWIEAGNEPRCLAERWSLAIQEAAKEKGIPRDQVPHCQDEDMGRTILDFLFAAQDATNSALTYSLDVLEAHPDVMEKMRQEVQRECKRGTNDVWTKIRDTDSLDYVKKVSNQMLHHKPPVPMIPHISKQATELGGQSLPKGTVVIPSIAYSARVGGGSLEFLPERPDQDSMFVKTVTFGAGQHKCPGRRYAESLLTVFLAVLAQDFDFHRTGPRPGLDEIMYYPTIFPSDCDFIVETRE